MTRAALTYAPRLLPAPEAAAYLGISASTLRTLSIPRRTLGARRLYDRLDLDAFASSLPVEGEDAATGANSCDNLFGAAP
jgi:hypothetical protein